MPTNTKFPVIKSQGIDRATTDSTQVWNYGTFTLQAGQTQSVGLVDVDSSNFYSAYIFTDNGGCKLVGTGWSSSINGSGTPAFIVRLENGSQTDEVVISLRLLQID